ncbi:MAG: rRNA maturation RNAse YbeY [Patescibacteria group bacterium]|nr:rRNA maturation RNAse YbeY [Patescibacteria group bacterium]
MGRIPFQRIKKEVLGNSYDLSVAFLSPTQMRRAMKYKKASTRKVSNVLAFPLSKSSGEILLCKEAAPPFSIAYLFIHGCLHLKGCKHGATMERIENRLLKKFGFRMHE